MNYFCHAIRYLDSPYFAAGVCVPDWLSVVDRKARMRTRKIDASLPELSGNSRELALGIRQHLHDDRWFHGTAAFYRVTAELAAAFRLHLPEGESWRCGFLGHIVMELLLDAALIEQQPRHLQQFYRTLEQVEPELVQQVVSQLAGREVERLAEFLPLFIREQFLDDYLTDDRLLFRLNQVMKRLQLDPLPAAVLPALATGRVLTRSAVQELLPAAEFPERHVLSGK